MSRLLDLFYNQGQGRPIGKRDVVDEFSPTSIPGLELWLDGNDISTLFQDSVKTTLVAADNDRVGCWADKSGNGNDILQATADNRGTYKTGIQNSLPVVRFDGTSDYLQGTFALAQPLTVFVVVDMTNVAVNARMIDGAGGNQMGLWNNANVKIQMSAGSDVPSANWVTGWHILTALFSGAASSCAVDVGTPVVCNPGTASPTGVTLAMFGGGTAWGAEDVAEVIIYDTNLSAANKLAVYSYLSTKWGI